MLLSLSQLSYLMLFAQNASVVVNVVLEDRLTLFQIESHKSVCIVQGHLRVKNLHWLVLD